MGKIKHWLRSMPLRRAFVSLVLVMAVFVAGISAATIFTCVNVQNHILESVTDYQVLPPQETEDEYNLVIADDEQIVPGENGQLCDFIHRVSNRQPKRYTAGRLLCGKSGRNPGADLAFRAWYNLLRLDILCHQTETAAVVTLTERRPHIAKRPGFLFGLSSFG